MNFLKKKKRKNEKNNKQKQLQENNQNHFHRILQENIQSISTMTNNSIDIIIRQFSIGDSPRVQAAVVYVDGLTNADALQDFLLETYMVDFNEIGHEKQNKLTNQTINYLKETLLPIAGVKEITLFEQLFNDIFSGKSIFFIDGFNVALSVSFAKWEERGVTETKTETVIRGPQEGFSENIRINTALVRRRIKNPNLWIEEKTVGTQTKTKIELMYMKGIVNEKVLQEVRERIDQVNVDSILESGELEQCIEDAPFSPFPTIYHSERPDAITGGLLEGRVAIFVDGTPFVLLVPALFVQFFQTPEDYYQRADIATFIRLLRFISFFIALLVPSFYVALLTFHQEMIPPQLIISLAAQREGVPFPAFFEALFMEVAFEILRESGLRMPKATGQAVSVVGALIIGTAAVEAGFISSAMVIVVSLTAIASFVFPLYSVGIAARMLRFAFIFLAAFLGLYGIFIGIMLLVLHLCTLRSFGIPYMSPLGPFIASDQKDAMITFPKWGLFTRPRLISQKNIVREKTSMPSPNHSNQRQS